MMTVDGTAGRSNGSEPELYLVRISDGTRDILTKVQANVGTVPLYGIRLLVP